MATGTITELRFGLVRFRAAKTDVFKTDLVWGEARKKTVVSRPPNSLYNTAPLSKQIFFELLGS